MFTKEEKEKAQFFKFSLSPLDELGNYLNPRYFSILNDGTKKQSEQKIPEALPQEIVLFWHDRILPQEIKNSIEAIKQHNLDYSVLCFDSEQAYEFIRLYYGWDLADLYKRRCVHPVMQSDMFRVCYLLQKGGIYIDIDIECYNHLDTIFAYQEFDCILSYTIGDPSCINNDLIICMPKSPLLMACLEKIQHHLTEKRSFKNIWDCTGPGAFSMVILELLMEKIIASSTFLSPLDKLKLVSSDRIKRAFNHAELSYKESSQGNWRLFRLPKNLYRL